MRVRALQSNFLKWINLFACLAIFITSHAQEITIVDPSGEPLESVLVFSDDYSFSTTSDLSGQVNITDLEKNEFLNFQLLGYQNFRNSIEEILAADRLVKLALDQELLDEVVVVGRTDIKKSDLPFVVQTIDQKKISLTNPQTSADALGQHANVFIQKSQMGGGSPIIRGFEANKILLVVDGVRLNNAIYRNGHLQNAITIDQGLIERTEVIFGPGSLTYGSDALGGVIHFRSKEPKLEFNEEKSLRVDPNLFARYASANNERSFHADVNIGGKKIAQLFSFSTSFFDDLKTGQNRSNKYPSFGLRPDYIETVSNQDIYNLNENPNVQVGTSYHQFDLMHKLLFQAKDDLQIITNLQFSTSSDIPRYDQLTERNDDGSLKFAEWYYGPQTRLLASAKINWYKPHALFDKLIFIPSFQFIEEDRIERRFESTLRGIQNEDVKVMGFTVDLQKEFDDLFLSYGIDGQFNKVNSVAFEEETTTGERNNGITRYPNDGSSMNIFGVYTSLSKSLIDEELRINTGVRFSTAHLNIQYLEDGLIDWPSEYYEGLNSQNQALTGSIGLNYTKGKFSSRLLLASAFRSPNIDDMAKIRIKNGEITIPNVELNPERSNTVELSLSSKAIKQTIVSLTGFYTQIEDAIIRQDFAFENGSNYIIDEGDSLRTVANINAQSGFIYGLSANVKATVSKNIRLSGNINFTKGRSMVEEVEQPLSHIPPIYGNIGIDYENTLWTSNLTWRYNMSKALKDYGGSSDNIEYATVDGTPAWSTLNVYNSFPYKSFVLNIAVENILDQHYRAFASGVSGAGRNFIVSLRWNI